MIRRRKNQSKRARTISSFGAVSFLYANLVSEEARSKECKITGFSFSFALECGILYPYTDF